jgi:hypothetical protein
MDADLVKEVIPFGVGFILLSPILMLIMRPNWSSPTKWAASLIASVMGGASISFIMGELAGELPIAVVAILIDTALVYTGSQIAYWLVWRSIGEGRLKSPDPEGLGIDKG